MTNVRRTFFLTKDEAAAIHEYVSYDIPHYELEDGTTLYGRIMWADIYTAPTWDTLQNIQEHKAKMDAIRNA